MRHPLTQLVLHGPACPEAGICTAALSGGADSTALLCVLHELRDALQIDLRAVHVHHGIRGDEADRDAAFCAQLCEKYSVPLQTVYVNAPALAASDTHLSLETAARNLRYAALEQAAPEGVIATAHHAGDNAETILFHLIRGSGLSGLCGIPPRNGRIIRPLLSAQRTDILAYLAEIGQDFIEDSSNFTAEAARNRIRQTVIPALMQENPEVLRHISRTAELLSADSALLTQQADDIFRRCYDPQTGALHHLRDYPQPLRMRVIMRVLRQMQRDPSYDLLQRADSVLLQGGKQQLGSGIYAHADGDALYLLREISHTPAEIPMQLGENRPVTGKICRAETLLSRNSHKCDTHSTLDFDKIIGKPYFRKPHRGDRIELPGRGFRTELRKCIQAAVPPPQRSRLLVLYDDAGCIWCEGVGIAARVKPDAQTHTLLTLTVTADHQG
ncbi:MAG TPA: tRNA lysidine(34) synthetase TilS [Ruminococcus sp.]|nr:tRNA lysidine(34) synthetase TilS [Ruminococcus sp.]